MFYMILGVSTIALLLIVNFLLLKYSCNKADSGKRQVSPTIEKESVMD